MSYIKANFTDCQEDISNTLGVVCSYEKTEQEAPMSKKKLIPISCHDCKKLGKSCAALKTPDRDCFEPTVQAIKAWNRRKQNE